MLILKEYKRRVMGECVCACVSLWEHYTQKTTLEEELVMR